MARKVADTIVQKTPVSKPAKRPKPPKPSKEERVRQRIANDPLARAGAREGFLPAFGHNSIDFEAARATFETAIAQAIRGLDALDREIAVLNARKTGIFAELRARKVDIAGFKLALAERRIDPLKRDLRDALMPGYLDAMNKADGAMNKADGAMNKADGAMNKADGE